MSERLRERIIDSAPCECMSASEPVHAPRLESSTDGAEYIEAPLPAWRRRLGFLSRWGFDHVGLAFAVRDVLAGRRGHGGRDRRSRRPRDNYGTQPVKAWALISPPEGWTDERTPRSCGR